MASHLARDGVGLLSLFSLVALLQRDDRELGQGHGPTDSSGYLIGALNTQTSMSIVVPSGDKGLEPVLLLHHHNL